LSAKHLLHGDVADTHACEHTRPPGSLATQSPAALALMRRHTYHSPVCATHTAMHSPHPPQGSPGGHSGGGRWRLCARGRARAGVPRGGPRGGPRRPQAPPVVVGRAGGWKVQKRGQGWRGAGWGGAGEGWDLPFCVVAVGAVGGCRPLRRRYVPPGVPCMPARRAEQRLCRWHNNPMFVPAIHLGKGPQ
jgi:hypothetical protein